MKKTNKVKVIVTLTVAIIIGIVMLFRINQDSKKINENFEKTQNSNEQISNENKSDNSLPEKNDEQQTEVQEEVQLIEDEGDLEIIIPEDQDSAGF